MRNAPTPVAYLIGAGTSRKYMSAAASFGNRMLH
jgi:hypothetical protein